MPQRRLRRQRRNAQLLRTAGNENNQREDGQLLRTAAVQIWNSRQRRNYNFISLWRAILPLRRPQLVTSIPCAKIDLIVFSEEMAWAFAPTA